MPSCHCFFVGLENDCRGVPKVFFPRNGIFIDRVEDIDREIGVWNL